jgi:GAF domain-containing protein
VLQAEVIMDTDQDTLEARRVAAVDSLRLLDTAPEPAFDHLVLTASQLCCTPVALVTLINADRQWFKAKVGTDVRETPREYALCNYTIREDAVMTVEDATRDQRFAENPLVVGPPHVRSYVGAPLITAEGLRVGTLCVIDLQTRRWSAHEVQTLRSLAQVATSLVEWRAAAEQTREAVSRFKTAKPKPAPATPEPRDLRGPLDAITRLTGALSKTRLDPKQREIADLLASSGQLLERALG